MAAMNKRLLISESHGDLNQCTPCRGKPDQHDMYAFHVSPRTSDVHFLQAVPVRGNRSWVTDRVRQSHCSWEKWLPTQSTTHRLSNPRVHTQSLSWANQWSSGESQTSVDSSLLGLPGPYHRHAIDTFNTCLRMPTHWSLTDTCGGYNLGGAGFPHTTPRLSQPAISTKYISVILPPVKTIIVLIWASKHILTAVFENRFVRNVLYP
jgi:hypothetical protein